ncbi:hypothetical protein SYN65AY6LI_01035 [Synechococcus sp. 65AY6Li]|nr:hypothetical protein SYN65AY6LI_01035 [Synechococcus sp. 65AY6Li]
MPAKDLSQLAQNPLQNRSIAIDQDVGAGIVESYLARLKVAVVHLNAPTF